MTNKTILYLLIISMVCVLSFSTLAAEEGNYGGILKAAMQANPSTLDPLQTTNTSTQQIVCYVFETLVAFDSDFVPKPVLLDSWEVANDNLSYMFNLRKGVKFHNGNIMKADDVKASLQRIIDISPTKGMYTGVSEIKVVDDYTLQVTLKEPMDLIKALCLPETWQAIMPKEYAESREELTVGKLIGTGPYKIVEWIPDVHVKLVRFEDYVPVDEPASGFVGKKIPYFDEIDFIPVKEVGARMAGLETGEYDYIEALPLPMVDTIEKNKNLVKQIVKPQWSLVWELNHAISPTNNVKFRQALMAALNMDEVMATVTGGKTDFYLVDPSLCFGPWSPWYTDIGKEYYNQNNVEKARRLLKEAGYTGEDIIILSNRDYNWMYKNTLAAAAQLEKAGINVKLEFSDWSSQIGKALEGKDWHINQSGWSPNIDPLNLTGSLQTGAPYSYSYSNPKMDILLGKLGKLAPFTERKEIWVELQKLYYEDVPVIHFGYLFGLEATRAEVKNYAPWYVTPRFWNVWK